MRFISVTWLVSQLSGSLKLAHAGMQHWPALTQNVPSGCVYQLSSSAQNTHDMSVMRPVSQFEMWSPP